MSENAARLPMTAPPMVGLLLGLGSLRQDLLAQLPGLISSLPGLLPPLGFILPFPPSSLSYVSALHPPPSECAFITRSNLVWALQGITMPYKALATSMGVVPRSGGWKELVWEGGVSGSYWAFDPVLALQFPHQKKDSTSNVLCKFAVYYLRISYSGTSRRRPAYCRGGKPGQGFGQLDDSYNGWKGSKGFGDLTLIRFCPLNAGPMAEHCPTVLRTLRPDPFSLAFKVLCGTGRPQPTSAASPPAYPHVTAPSSVHVLFSC